MSATSVSHNLTPHVTLPMNRPWLVLTAVGCCWLLVLASLAYPAFYVEWPRGAIGAVSAYPSAGIFFFGWLGLLGMLDGEFQMIGWLANPFFLLTSIWLLVRNDRNAAVTGAVSLVFAFASFLMHEAIMNAAGHEARITQFATGFHLWVSAIGLQAALAAFLAIRRPKTPTSPIFED